MHRTRTPSPLGRRQTAYHSSSVEPFVAFPDVVGAGIGKGYLSISLLCTLTLRHREENRKGRCQFEKRQGPNVPSAWPVTLTHLPVSEGKRGNSMQNRSYTTKLARFGNRPLVL